MLMGHVVFLNIVLSGKPSSWQIVTPLKMQTPDRDLVVTFLAMTGDFRAVSVLVGARLRKMRLLVCQIEVYNSFKTSKQELLLYRQPAYLKHFQYIRGKISGVDPLEYSRFQVSQDKKRFGTWGKTNPVTLEPEQPSELQYSRGFKSWVDDLLHLMF